jgi:hypothetical protein
MPGTESGCGGVGEGERGDVVENGAVVALGPD